MHKSIGLKRVPRTGPPAEIELGQSVEYKSNNTCKLSLNIVTIFYSKIKALNLFWM